MKLSIKQARELSQKKFLHQDLQIWKHYSDYYNEKDHPVYRKRILEIQAFADKFQVDAKIRQVKYTDAENKIWKTVFSNCLKEIKDHGSEEFIDGLTKMVDTIGVSENEIPQLNDISDYLYSQTGWIVRPVSGLMSPRSFFEGLANKVFCSTQFIRSQSDIDFSPLPDILHETLGHATTLSTDQFSELAQMFGKISLTATDKQIDDLAHLYWFTSEVGLLKQNGEVKIYGAAIVSSPKETKSCVHPNANIQDFNIEQIMGSGEIHPDGIQNKYFASKSVQEAIDDCGRYFSANY